jgi:hypothetical protein
MHLDMNFQFSIFNFQLLKIVTKIFLLTFCFFITLSLIVSPFASAQTAVSPCVLTRVGNPAISPVYPPGCDQTPSGGGSNPGGQPGGIKPPNYPADLQQAILDTFGVNVRGYGPEHLKWIWEKLWDVSGTKFNGYIRGVYLQGRPASKQGSRQVGCGGPTSIILEEYNPEDLFKFLFTHELGHYIRNCSKGEIVRLAEHLDIFNTEGPISYYAGHTATCTGLNNGPSEDYADMVAYYLNPNAGLRAISCDPERNPPNPYFKLIPRKEMHYQFVVELLQ